MFAQKIFLKSFKNSLFALLSIVIALLVLGGFGEVALRMGGYKIFSFYPISTFYQFDKLLGWEHIPDIKAHFVGGDFDSVVQINHLKYRDKIYPIQKEAGHKRVMVLGDSAVWGWSVNNNEIFTELAEKKLKDIDVINFGRCGYGTDQNMLYFEREGMQYKPDTVALVFNACNDLTDIKPNPTKTYFELKKDGSLNHTNLNPSPRKNGVQSFLIRHSLLYFFIDYRLAILKRKIGYLKQKLGIASLSPYDALVTTADAATDDQGYINFVIAENKKSWPVTIALLERLRKDIESIGAKFLIYSIGCNQFGIEELIGFAAQHHIPFIDLVQETEQYLGGPEHDLRVHDGHWNQAGHKVTAELFLNSLYDNHIIDDKDLKSPLDRGALAPKQPHNKPEQPET